MHLQQEKRDAPSPLPNASGARPARAVDSLLVSCNREGGKSSQILQCLLQEILARKAALGLFPEPFCILL